MARYIYDELKEEFKAEGVKLDPGFIFQCMAQVVHEMGYTAPGELPEELYETYKQKTKERINELLEYYAQNMRPLVIRALKNLQKKKAKNNRS